MTMAAVQANLAGSKGPYSDKINSPGSPNGSCGSLTDEACVLPYADHTAAIELALQCAEQRAILERRVSDGEFQIGDCSNKTRLIRRLGGGTFGEVYLGESAVTGDPVAVKVELNGSWNRQQLLHEGSVYRKLSGGPGIPDVRWFGMHGADYSAMVMDLLGPALYAVWSALGERFSIKTLLMIIDQTVETVGHVHRCGFVHRDISPSNFLLNSPPEASRIQLIDYGQAKRIANGAVGSGSFQLVPASISRHKSSLPRPVTGTPRFASIWSHAGYDAAYRDDMESLGYLWIYLARGRLPWQGIRDCAGLEKINKIGQLKASISAEELCAGLPDEFATYMNYIRSLRPFDLPDHDGVRDLFRGLGDQLEVGVYNWQFDWSQSSPVILDSNGSVVSPAKKFFFPPESDAQLVDSTTDAVADSSVLLEKTIDAPSSGDETDDPSVTSVSK